MAYTRVNWVDGETGGTPISAQNLNVMDLGIYNNANDITTANTNISSVTSRVTTVESTLTNKQNTISSGTSLPSTATDGDIFLLYS